MGCGQSAACSTRTLAATSASNSRSDHGQHNVWGDHTSVKQHKTGCSLSSIDKDRRNEKGNQLIHSKQHYESNDDLNTCESVVVTTTSTRQFPKHDFVSHKHQKKMQPSEPRANSLSSVPDFALFTSSSEGPQHTVASPNDGELWPPTLPYLGLTVFALEEFLQSLPKEERNIPLEQLLLCMSPQQLLSTFSWASKRRRRCRAKWHGNNCRSCRREHDSFAGRAMANAAPRDQDYQNTQSHGHQTFDCGVRPANIFVVHYPQQSVQDLAQGLRAYVDAKPAGVTLAFWIPFLCIKGDKDSVDHIIYNKSGSAKVQRMVSLNSFVSQTTSFDEKPSIICKSSNPSINPILHATGLLQGDERSIPDTARKEESIATSATSHYMYHANSEQPALQDIPSSSASDGEYYSGWNIAQDECQPAYCSLASGVLVPCARIVNLVTDIGRIVCVAHDLNELHNHISDDQSFCSQCCLALSRGASLDIAVEKDHLARILAVDDKGPGSFDGLMSAFLGPPECRAFNYANRMRSALQRPSVQSDSGLSSDQFTVPLSSSEHQWLLCKCAESLAQSASDFMDESTKEDIALCPSAVHVVHALRDCGRVHAACALSKLVLENRLEYNRKTGRQFPHEHLISDAGVASAAAAAGACFKESMNYVAAIKYMTLARSKFQSFMQTKHSSSTCTPTLLQLVREQYLDAQAVLGELQALLGDVAGSMQTLQSCIVLQQNYLGEDNRHTLHTAVRLATIFHENDDLDAALELFMRAVQGLHRNSFQGDPVYLIAIISLAVVYVDRKEYKLAMPVLGEAMSVHEKVLGDLHVRTLCCYTHVFHNMIKLGDGDALVAFACEILSKLAQNPDHQCMSTPEAKELLKFSRRIQSKLLHKGNDMPSVTFRSQTDALSAISSALSQFDKRFAQVDNQNISIDSQWRDE